MVGSKEEADESQSFAAACYVHNLFRGGMRLKQVHIGYWLVAKALMKHVKGIGADTHTYVPWRI
jgi:hypothetical protein